MFATENEGRMAQSVLQIEIDADVGERLAAEARAKGEPVPMVAGDLLREAFERRDDYKACFIREVEIDLREADEPNAVFISHEVVMEEWRVEREHLMRRAESREL